MSDTAKDLEKNYEDNVRPGQPRNNGLSPIPEGPEFEVNRGMWSAALNAILTTLRYLAPANLLALLWGQQSLLFRLLNGIDSAFRAIVYSSEEQKQEVLSWLAEAGPVRVEHLDTVWRHGWIICGVLDSAFPGACAGHPPTRFSLQHAQAIAEHYLGVDPVFSRKELESTDALSRHQEWKLATYLDRIRQALAKLTPPVSKPTSQRTSPEITQFTLDYVAKGTGLTAAQVNNKMHFKIYPTSQQSLDPGEITLLIRGPKDTYGLTVIPPILGKAQLIRQQLLGLQAKRQFTENVLPITQGATYFRNYGKNNMNTTYHIPKTKYDIDITVETKADHVRVGYNVALEGKYEISITSRGQNIVGSPFCMVASKNIINVLERDSFCLEDGEEIDIVDIKTDRKVVLRIVDFVTEKMLLRENGMLEKITNDEAKVLMSTDSLSYEYCEESRACSVTSTTSDDYIVKCDKFSKTVYKVVQMNRVCKIINSLLSEKKAREISLTRPRSQQSIPDIVNSTFSETNVNPFIMAEKRVIVPENIAVSLRTEKSKLYDNEKLSENKAASNFEIVSPDSLDTFESIPEQSENEAEETRRSTSNPFLNDTYEQNYVMEKDLGSFVKTEYETNKAQTEETERPPIQIVVENMGGITPIPSPTNPFASPELLPVERPKTPILKIITGEVRDRDIPLYVDREVEQTYEEKLGNEFVNPFFTRHHLANEIEKNLVTDFIIGAPVSSPPMIRAPTPEPNMESIIVTEKFQTGNDYQTEKKEFKRQNNSTNAFSNPEDTLHKFNDDTLNSQTFYSLGSDASDSVEIINLSNDGNNEESYQINVTPKKDMWDSAYVSIDENNSSPDNNNNDNTTRESPCKQTFSLSDTCYQIENMGPAEIEIWQTCTDLSDAKIYDELKPKIDIKRPIFTPILEESDRSMSTGTKDIARSGISPDYEQLSVTVALAELKDKCRNNANDQKYAIMYGHVNQECKNTINRDDTSVDSASGYSDVKRHAENIEGKISEVQSSVTESVSVSQGLRKNASLQDKDEIDYTNIVLEKKQYWDQRIREIEAKSTEEDQTQKRRRLSGRHLRQNDSLTKQRGKQLDKNFITKSTQKNDINNFTTVEVVSRRSPISNEAEDLLPTDAKLVEKWKNYWDNKLESEREDNDVLCFGTKSPKSKESSASPPPKSNDDKNDINRKNFTPSTAPVKQELPEEVFKAFETSPKRFFGTSRKQILNKIDTFLGKPSIADESPDLSSASNEPDTGLVSSRISLFHTISKTEDNTWNRRKCQSMHNIFNLRESERRVSLSEDEKTKISTENLTTKVAKIDQKCVTVETDKLKRGTESAENVSLQQKRGRMVQNMHNKSFDETVYKKPQQIKWQPVDEPTPSVKRTISEYNKHSISLDKFKTNNSLKKSSMSKSEMDIFTKITNKPIEDDLDKYKSCDELPKINVKNFINLYETVSKTDVKKPVRKISRTSSLRLHRSSFSSTSTGTVNNVGSTHFTTKLTKPSFETDESTPDLTQASLKRWNKNPKANSNSSIEPKSLDSIDVEIVSNDQLAKCTTYVSLSDMELEIVENANELASNKVKERSEIRKEKQEKKEEMKENISDTDYKSRFKLAKEFFKSLEEFPEIKKPEPKKLNECELLLLNKSNESLENERPQRRVKKNIKAHSMPSSEISKIWDKLQESQSKDSKLVKISEKFNIDDLFNDVMEGKLSRQGSLRGIPNKKAVLEAFRSMENLTDSKISSYEIAVSQLNDFAKENHIKNAQTYLTEYPYLPKTDPSKYHSRLDVKATGLISLKELHSQKPRRNSVPDLRLNPTFTVQL